MLTADARGSKAAEGVTCKLAVQVVVLACTAMLTFGLVAWRVAVVPASALAPAAASMPAQHPPVQSCPAGCCRVGRRQLLLSGCQ